MLSSFVISSYTIPSFNLLLRASFRYRVRAFATSSRLRNPTRFLPLPFKPFFATTSSFSSSSSSSPLNACGSRTEDDSLVILGIETSCDDTAAAIVRSDGEILSQVVSSQADLLSRYGGVAPKMAEEAHVQVIDQVVQQALDNANLTEVDLSAVAVTIGPGLSLCLRVGVQKARRIAGKFNLPIIGIHHMEAHALVARLIDKELQFPFLALLISGDFYMLTFEEQFPVTGFFFFINLIKESKPKAYKKPLKKLRPEYESIIHWLMLQRMPSQELDLAKNKLQLARVWAKAGHAGDSIQRITLHGAALEKN